MNGYGERNVEKKALKREGERDWDRDRDRDRDKVKDQTPSSPSSSSSVEHLTIGDGNSPGLSVNALDAFKNDVTLSTHFADPFRPQGHKDADAVLNDVALSNEVNTLRRAETERSQTPSKDVKKSGRKVRERDLSVRPSFLEDSLGPDMTVLFVGLNPSPTTAAQGFAYAHPTNSFWKLLHESGFTPTRKSPADTHRLLGLYKYGFTNLCARPSRLGSDLTPREMLEGAQIVVEKVRANKPKNIVIVGKSVAQTFERLFRQSQGKRGSSRTTSRIRTPSSVIDESIPAHTPTHTPSHTPSQTPSHTASHTPSHIATYTHSQDTSPMELPSPSLAATPASDMVAISDFEELTPAGAEGGSRKRRRNDVKALSIGYGRVDESWVHLFGTPNVYLATSTSGLARGPYEEKLRIWREIADAILQPSNKSPAGDQKEPYRDGTI